MPASKPEDYRLLFDGNNDDCFRCALRLTRKAAKLCARRPTRHSRPTCHSRPTRHSRPTCHSPPVE